ncbi:RHS repeat-associated core domain-containing protein [Gordonia jinhuaensis]|uniref:RHS repeat-associated core domain-containing protein n=1 Tax=Gordonia jinhuaensis TaxID=1517702 RepID=UPI001E4314A1|nr:RHS repeat-associated core domain-containing protein [Gordonia jinhuaensis]
MPVALVDTADGSVAGQAAVSLWGRATWSGETTPLRFPGQYADPESGLFYNVFRYYNPDTGRYLSPDPLGLAPAPNNYTYPSNPTVVCDPLGLDPGQHSGQPINHGPITDQVHQRLDQIDNNQWPQGKGTRGGGAFANIDRPTGDNLLPAETADGRAIQYREWDMNPKVTGQPRDAQRILTGSDGSAWFTKDHYQSFYRIR